MNRLGVRSAGSCKANLTGPNFRRSRVEEKMALSIAARPMCAVCGDRFGAHADCCGRCNRLVCRACSRQRGRSHESVLCDRCYGSPKPSGFRASGVYRSWKRLLAA